MEADRWARVAEVYQTALERPPDDRAAYLTAACAGDEDLRVEVASLLAQAEKPALVDAPVWQAAAAVLDDNAAVQPGTRIGPYEVTAFIGEGGMGQVYRARDTTLGRDVALKVLPATFNSDGDRLARFRREAHVLASLNHTNVGAIYGFETSGTIHALVLELVDGPTLADRIAQGPIPVDEALSIARQIADALESAHERGIVHRDLKPANIKLRLDGTVKVLDFGLAKALDSEEASSRDGPSRPAVTASPTVVSPAVTAAGVILGTAAYMAPEQAKGKPADKRSDIWAFGCVLYEMLTSKRAFAGEDVGDTLAAVLRGTPDWSALPSLPQALRALITGCLEKDRRERLADASALRFLMRQATETTTVPTASQTAGRWSRGRMVGPLIATVVIAAASMWAVGWRGTEPGLHPMRFAIEPEGVATTDSGPQLALSADGRLLVYTADRRGVERIFVRPIDRVEASPIQAMLGSSITPFLSPDGKWVGFFPLTRGDLSKVPVADGMASVICQFTGRPRGAAWGADNTIVFATSDPASGLLRVSVEGGPVEVLTTPDVARGEVDHLFPSILPGGTAVLFTVAMPGAPHGWQIAALDLQTRTRRTLIQGASYARYSVSGHLLYASAGKLHAIRFDPSRLEVSGEPVLVADPIDTSSTGAAQFTVSDNGTLAYVSPSTDAGVIRRSLIWVGRDGREEPITAPPKAYTYARLAPDGTRVALDVRDENNDIWIWNLRRETLTRLTFDAANDVQPVWTPDGQRILFGSNRGGTMDLFAQRADGSGAAERVVASGTALYPQAIAPDGASVVVLDQSNVGNSLSLLKLHAAERVEPLLQRAINPDISPDGRWLAYQSSESGRSEVYVRPFSDVSAGRWQVSIGGGRWPKWAGNGGELFYVVDETMMSAPVQLASTFSAGKPSRLFDSAGLRAFAQARTYDVTRDGQKFLMITAADRRDRPAPSIVVVANWAQTLKQSASTADGR